LVDNWVTLDQEPERLQINVRLSGAHAVATTSPNNTPNWVSNGIRTMGVDTDGNQLPYLDKVSLTLAESLEVANLRAMAGELDLQTRHMDLQKLPGVPRNPRRAITRSPRSQAGRRRRAFSLTCRCGGSELPSGSRARIFAARYPMGIDRRISTKHSFSAPGTLGSVAISDDRPTSWPR